MVPTAPVCRVDVHVIEGGVTVATTVTPAPGCEVTPSPPARGGELLSIVFDGDSITRGRSATETRGYVNICVNGTGGDPLVHNLGADARTLATMLANAPHAVDVLHDPDRVNIASILAGTNDLYLTGDSAATVYANLVSYHQGRRLAGFKTIAYTVMPRSNAGTPANFESRRVALNALIIDGWPTFADALVDLGNDPIMGAPGASEDATYFADGVHPTNAGHARIGSLVRRALAELGFGGAHDHAGPTSVFLPGASLAARTGSPTEYTLGVASGWALPDASTTAVAVTAEVPQDWSTYTTDLLWANLAPTTGVVRVGTLHQGIIPGMQIANAPTVWRSLSASSQSVATLTTWSGAATPVPDSRIVTVAVAREGGATEDTLSGAIVLLGVILRKAS